MNKNSILLLLIFFFSIFAVVIQSNTILNHPVITRASGTPTAQGDSRPGQVIVNRDGEVIYLTTQTTGLNSQAATKSTTASSGLRNGFTSRNIVIPTGFAEDIGAVINAVLSLVMVIAALLVFLNLIWAGFQWITSGGDKSKTEEARSRILAAIVGLIILASSYAILTLALRFLGFDDLNAVFDNTLSLDYLNPN